MFYIPLLVVMMKLLLVDKMKTTNKLISVALMLLVFWQRRRIVNEDYLYLLVLFVVGAYGIDFKKILKIYLVESLILVLFYTILAGVGIIPNNLYFGEGHNRYALGSRWCTNYSAKLFFMILICLYLFSKKMKWFHWLLLLGLSALVFKFTYGKLDFICSVLTMIVFYLHEYLDKKDENSKVKLFWNNCLTFFSGLFTPIAVTIITLLTLLYSPSNSFMEKLNLTLTNRLELGKRAFSDIGLSLFGTNVRWIGMSAHIKNPSLKYNFVDCSYLNLMFQYGVIAAIFFITVFTYMAYRNRKDLKFVLVVALISLNCIVAHHFIDLTYNPFWLILLADTVYRQTAESNTSVILEK